MYVLYGSTYIRYIHTCRQVHNIPTYAYTGLCNCHFRSRKGAEPEQGRFNQSCEQGCLSSRGASPEEARASPSKPEQAGSAGRASVIMNQGDPFPAPQEAFFGVVNLGFTFGAEPSELTVLVWQCRQLLAERSRRSRSELQEQIICLYGSCLYKEAQFPL